MDYYYIPNTNISEDKESALEEDGALQRGRRPQAEGPATSKAVAVAGAGALGADIAKT